MKANYIHDCITITRNNGHVIESRAATRQVEELEKANSELLENLIRCVVKLEENGFGDMSAVARAKKAILKTTE